MKITSMRQIQSHQPVMRSHDGLIHLKIRWASAQGLNIDTPFLGIEVECVQCSGLTGQFDFVYELVAAVVSCAGVTLGILVGHRRAKGIEDGARSKVLRGYQHDGFTLALDFFFLYIG